MSNHIIKEEKGMKKKMKRMAAIAMAAAMAFSTPVGASSGTVDVSSGVSGTTSGTEAKVLYKKNVDTVIVPTTLAVAFNPDGLPVVLNGDTVKDQVVSKAVGIVSKATKNIKVAVKFNVEADGNIKFVTSDEDAVLNEDKADAYNVFLQMVASDDSHRITAVSGTSGAKDIEVNSGSANGLSVDATELSNVNMTAYSGSSGAIAVTSGTTANFLVGMADYTYEDIDFNTYSGTNEVAGTLDKLGSGTKSGSDWTAFEGVTGFKFTGKLNKNAKWYNVGANTQVRITPVYKLYEAEKTDQPIAGSFTFMGAEGTAAVADADPEITNVTKFTKASPNDVVISFTLGSGDKAVEADGAVLLQGADDSAVNVSKYTVNMNAKTITVDKTAGFMVNATANVPIKVQLKNGDEVVKTISGTIVIE